MTDQNSKLTHRECEILVLIATGKHNKEISQHLAISEATVENHLHNIYQKLGVSNRVQATLYAIQTRLIMNGIKNEGNPS